ncbi:hypothetical protein [Leclercia tamurae]|uniref:Uncharacterized protein n=1 Tax=Leclercia tamurae TaxID=2926467 RepID=A0ABT2RCW8_9ENTR|nr:hypothetical protein [Leclercia tamurae]MCU6678633.1 hypothetical protein [Leclercia tamurae]
MSELDVLHNKIGQLLVNAGPADAKTIIARAKLARDGESCEYEYDYIYQQDNEDWFVPDKLASYHLRLLLVNLRDYYMQNNMTNGKAPWTGCDITIDIPAEKISINLKYDE